MIELKSPSAHILMHLSVKDITVFDESRVDIYNLVSKNIGNIGRRSASTRIGLSITNSRQDARAIRVTVGPVDDDLEDRASLTAVSDIPCI